ncbi:uncharacterized protein LOC119070119 [Bradysia coprophila]|uniref:uncharacterized protein LOC119070119 n=1 Tax=Bradysia coprophila TaxID=38358 RepID=UPI00187D9C7D|nr:uncharacterized protein LOC119070119 [Bradysia coprophila]
MALTKCFVILFLVYLNFDTSPIDCATIPERLDSPDSINENDENSDIYTTTGATEEDIEKIFETYENLYIKNSNWLNDDELAKNANNEKLSEIQLEEETTARDSETTEQTADDVVESIQNIMDEKNDAKKNRTDRTIVVVVTTNNVFNINGSDETSKRQHTLLSFGTPGMIQKETSTDATLAMHNKITTAFFNSNPTSIVGQPENSVADDSKSIVLDDPVGDAENIPHATEAGEEVDARATDQPNGQSVDDYDLENLIDIRRLDPAGVESAKLSRSYNDELTSDDSNDILRIMKIIPSRSVDESSTGSLSKPFEIPFQEPQDSSLMEAIENILDTDVRKAFERDIPQTHHVPLDINIEEEALYAPLKDLSEYIVEEVPINVNYEMFADNKKFGDTINKVVNVEEISRKLVENDDKIETFGNIEKSSEHMNYNRESDSVTESDNLTDELVTETEQKTTTLTTEEPIIASTTEEATPTTKITDDKETRTSSSEAALLEEITTTNKDEETTSTTDGPASNAANEQTEGVNEYEESYTPTTTAHHEAPLNDNKIEVQNEKLNEAHSERVETLQKSALLDADLLSQHGQPSNSANIEQTESISENVSDVPDKIPETPHIPNGESTSPSAGTDNTFAPESSLSMGVESNLQPIQDDKSSSVIGTFEKLVDQSFDDYPIYVHLDTTTEYVTNPNLYIGASFSGAQVAAIMAEAERARTASNVQILSSKNAAEFSTEESFADTPGSFIDAFPSQGEVKTSFDLEDKLDERDDTSDGVEDKRDEAEDRPDGAEDRSDGAEDKPDGTDDRLDGVDDSRQDAKASLEEAKDRLEKAEDRLEEAEDQPEEDKNYRWEMLQARNAVEVAKAEVNKAVHIVKLIEWRFKDIGHTTTKPHGEDVVSEVVKADEETTEQHQIIKKPGVDDATNGTIVTKINVTIVESKHLVPSGTTNFESRSFGDNDEPVDPLRTLVEAVELTADITKSVDNFQSFIDPNDSIHLAANQVIENKDDMELVESAEKLKVAEASSVWPGAATYIYFAGAVLSIGLIVLLGIVSYLRFRQFKRNLLFSC